MADEIRVVEVTPDSLCESPCCGIKNAEHEGRIAKTKWLKTYFKKGLKAKIVLGEKDIQAGYIEYLPGECAWRAVEANGYMFIPLSSVYETRERCCVGSVSQKWAS